MNDSARSLASTTAATPPPWGFWASFGWGLLSIGLWLAAQLVAISATVAVIYGSGIRPSDLPPLERDPLVTAAALLAAAPAQIALLVIAARGARWSPAEYFGLIRPTTRQLIFALTCLALVLVAMDVVTYLLGREIVPAFLVELYRNARAHGGLVVLLLAIVVAAPIAEEITFRGFLYRGWSQSSLGIWGTILLTSLAWTALHVQYDWFGMFQVFLLGILLGWLRWASGSTRLTIVLHMFINAAATVQAAIKVEWMS